MLYLKLCLNALVELFYLFYFYPKNEIAQKCRTSEPNTKSAKALQCVNKVNSGHNIPTSLVIRVRNQLRCLDSSASVDSL